VEAASLFWSGAKSSVSELRTEGSLRRWRATFAAFGWWWADPLGALAMLPVILWQGWETFEEAREDEGDEE
jgi:hypothetical protein